MYDTAIYIGRFEPVHNGHMALLHQALTCARSVIVVVGSAWQARSPKNPFTFEERRQMMAQALEPALRARVRFLPVRDYYNEAVWVDAVRRGVATLAGGEALLGRVGLVGHFKDATSNYLKSFPGWELIHVPRQGPIDATTIRDAYLGDTGSDPAKSLAPVASDMPASTRDFLQAFAARPDYAALQEEWQMLRHYRQAWATAPYPPVFVTVDAVVRCQDHVLLIRRAQAPGKGQRAVPGGFIEQRETLWQSCLRELAEETHCALTEPQWQAALRAVSVFDHPDRSQRGRTITHAHYFDLEDAPLPPVRADDDAASVEWVPVAALAAMESEFFEDHFHMLDHFLGLTGAAQVPRMP